MRLWQRPAMWALLTIIVFSIMIRGQLPDDASPDRAQRADSSPVVEADPIQSVSTTREDGASASDGEHVDETTVATAVAPVSVDDGRDDGDDRDERYDGIGGPDEEEADLAVTAMAEAPVIMNHVVQNGETLSQIAARYGVDQTTLMAANELLDANVLLPGQELNILTIPGALHSVRRGESLWEIARLYRTDMGVIAEMNDLDDPGRIVPQQQLVIPGREAADIGSTIRSEMLLSPEGRLLRAFSWPLTGRLSSPYGMRWGRMHHGIDVAVNTGTPVRAAARGRVTFAGARGTYGILVIIDHGNGIETRYAHLSRTAVRTGQNVTRDTIIAHSGNTGNSTGPHLHFEIRLRGNSVDPLSYLR